MGLFSKSRHARLMVSAAVGALALGSGAAYAQTKPITIAPQTLASALHDFGAQTGRQIMFTPESAASKMSRGVDGATDEEMALAQLLQGTGLSFRREANVFIIMGSADPQSESAAGDGADSGTVDTLVVTAQKREEDIQDVPIAISAFTQEDLTRSQVAGGPDLITQVPNMTFTKTNFSSYSVQLRGIGTQAISATTDPAVAVAFNNTPFIRNRFFEQEFYDLQRVEVLRGPQGTLYGRNATAGVVNIISQKPKFQVEAKLSGDVSNFNSSRLEGMVNIPLVEDMVALRIAGAWTKRDGYATNELTGNPIDGRDLWSTRLSLRVTPNDRFDANLIWEHFEEDDDRLRSGKQLCKKDVVTEVAGFPTTYEQVLPTTGQNLGFAGVQGLFSQGCARVSLYSPDAFQTPNGRMIPYYLPLGAIGLPTALSDPYVSRVQSQDLRVIESAIDPEYTASSNIGELQISFDLTDSLTLASETAYATDEVFSFQDFNRFNTQAGAWGPPRPSDRPGVLLPGPNGGIFCDPQLGCSDRLVAVDIATAAATQFSQELRLSSDFEGPFNFSLGANFLRADSEDKYYVFINSLSLFAARAFNVPIVDPYVGGQSDNIECMMNGWAPGDPSSAYPVAGCAYIDPNPIGSLNDDGHNYFLSKNPYKLISYAVFGEAYYQVTDALKMTAGLRWTVDKKEAPRIPTWILNTQSVGYPVAEVIEQEWREPTGRLAIDWKPDLGFTDETLVYASYARGYKAGGANPPGFVRGYFADKRAALTDAADSETRPKTFDPEFVDAYELGMKNTLFDGSATLNLAAFYYDYRDYQISEIVDRSAFNRNFDATVWGVELESDWRPLENLKFGLKIGYEKTRLADGEQAIDLMDRTAGDSRWTLMRPFPTYASSCIVPTWLLLGNAGGFSPDNPELVSLGGIGGGNPGACEYAYIQGVDPVSRAPYAPNPSPFLGAIGVTHIGNINYAAYSTDINDFAGWPTEVPFTGLQRYPGWNPATAPNGGEGIMKSLGGNELPNAPQWTATITADYTLPLPNEWFATLHTDLHWQAESWWRIFQDHEFARLDEYFTMNLAAIFTNEDGGWNVMAYIKNVTDETAITGAFLNSDDTGLTANVFLTEPRLYGLRVTKAWTGGPLLGSFGYHREGPYPFTLELEGQAQRHDASADTLMPPFSDEFDTVLDVFDDHQRGDLDWGDGRAVRLTWRPNSGPWSVSGGVRYGRTGTFTRGDMLEPSDPVCAFGGPYVVYCELLADDLYYGPVTRFTRPNNAQSRIYDHEEHQIVDLMVGRDVGLGSLKGSTFSAGLRHATLESTTDAEYRGTPDWSIPEGFGNLGLPVTMTLYHAEMAARREFNGFGPVASWQASYPVLMLNQRGRVSVDWALEGGVLFGERETHVTGEAEKNFWTYDIQNLLDRRAPARPITTVLPSANYNRTEEVTAPTAAVNLGLSYEVGGFKAAAGYRWERYFDALDDGFDQAADADRTIDGPYFKLAVGFGG